MLHAVQAGVVGTKSRNPHLPKCRESSQKGWKPNSSATTREVGLPVAST